MKEIEAFNGAAIEPFELGAIGEQYKVTLLLAPSKNLLHFPRLQTPIERFDDGALAGVSIVAYECHIAYASVPPFTPSENVPVYASFNNGFLSIERYGAFPASQGRGCLLQPLDQRVV
ncbi:MAG: hypothetical protein ACFUZC_17315 [Chthoniobacteraceae bacterium]